MFDTSKTIESFDPDVAKAIDLEHQRQEEHIELIASENYTSPLVMKAQGSRLTNKYAEGYPGKRYYGGCEFVDEVETLASERAKELFGAAYANRGILNDRNGNYEAAIADYEKAAAMEAELNEGPAWLIRFLRNQPQQQATILERAQYLRAQLELPEDQRLLRVPELDARQRAYDQ